MSLTRRRIRARILYGGLADIVGYRPHQSAHFGPGQVGADEPQVLADAPAIAGQRCHDALSIMAPASGISAGRAARAHTCHQAGREGRIDHAVAQAGRGASGSRSCRSSCLQSMGRNAPRGHGQQTATLGGSQAQGGRGGARQVSVRPVAGLRPADRRPRRPFLRARGRGWRL